MARSMRGKGSLARDRTWALELLNACIESLSLAGCLVYVGFLKVVCCLPINCELYYAPSPRRSLNHLFVTMVCAAPRQFTTYLSLGKAPKLEARHENMISLQNKSKK